MALKGKPVAIGNSSTTIYTCPAGTEAAVHGLIFSNNTGSALAVDVLVYNQADNTTTTVATDLAVAGNSYITWTKPMNLNAGDSVRAISSAASGLVCLYSVYEGSAAPVATGFTGRGVWSSGSTYAVNDIVTVVGIGTYLALQASTNQDPATATAYWMFLEGISASALPAQGGNSGKYLTTDGTDASWAALDVAGGGTVTAMSADLTLTSASERVQSVTATTTGLSIILPNPTSLSEGESFAILHKGAENVVLIKNHLSEILGALLPGKMYKFFLVDIATNNWEASITDIGGNLVSLTTLPLSGTFTAGYQSPTVMQKTGTGTYTMAYFYYVGAYRYRHNKFRIETDGSITSLYEGIVNLSYGAFPGYATLNSNCFIDTDISLTRGYRSAAPYEGRITLVESVGLPAGTAPNLQHTYDVPSSNEAYNGAVTKIGTRKAFSFGTSYSATADTTARWTILDYSSSLSSPTVGNGTFSTGGSLSPEDSDADALTDSLVLVGFNTRTATTTYEKKVIACTISGTSATFGSAVSVNTGSNASGIKIRRLSATKAIVGYPKTDGNYYAKIATLSGTTITLGSEFKLASFAFGLSAQIIPKDENNFFVTGTYSTDGFRSYAFLVTISGSSFVSATAPAKMSDINSATNNSPFCNGVFETDDNTIVFTIPSSSTNFVGKAAATVI